jgi:hypothetical protein
MGARLAVLVLLASGCATQTQALDHAALKAARGSRPGLSIGAVRSEPTSLYVRTAGRAMTGVLGMVLMASEGQTIVKEHKIPEPSDAITIRLWQMLSQTHGLTARTPTLVGQSGMRPLWSTDLVLRVATTRWELFYFPLDWTHYRLAYEATFELFDSRDQRVLASGACQAPYPEESAGAPTFNRLMARDAAVLKRTIEKAAEFCTKQFAREVLGTRLPEDPAPAPDPPPAEKYASCNLEGSAAWKEADAITKRDLLHACWDERRASAPVAAATPPVPPVPPVAPVAPVPAVAPVPPMPPPADPPPPARIEAGP